MNTKKQGEHHFNWKGDSAKYFAIHNWIREKLDRSNCEHCGISGYRYKNGMWSIECANISGRYERQVKDWIVLCRKCHRKYDISKRPIEVKDCITCNNKIEAIFALRKKFCDECLHERKKIKGRDALRIKRGFRGLTNSSFYSKNKVI